ncbi:hypothetical protein GQX74_001080 [Glossina fuscipes]|nr:hypothetical protein GQX74_001080 [Glossina fuscipes]
MATVSYSLPRLACINKASSLSICNRGYRLGANFSNQPLLISALRIVPFHKTWRGGYSRSVETTASGWNDLTASTMDGISMQSYIRARALKSSLELTSPLSMSSGKPSGIGIAFMTKRLCLLGDLDRHCWLDSSNTVSRYDTTGSDFLRGMQA